MIIRKRHINWLIVLFFVAIVAVVFQQIHTSMSEQGIATGGPYDNAAAYPRYIAILIGLLVAFQVFSRFVNSDEAGDSSTEYSISELTRPMFLLLIFGIYLGLLGVLGYHLTTAPMILAIMVLCGVHPSIYAAINALLIAFVLAYAFEVFLKVVLPGGIFSLNIPW
ncbi:MAG: tripartite tricarboxylate transporter TctB family protein [Hyphomicrobiales bacterium]